ncbi:MAG: DUF2782 domain-containing protein [Gammaproteobacteria bacterium]|nr:DUF2782 domain-containing protein [Gammaproteobacteria bacterium]
MNNNSLLALILLLASPFAYAAEEEKFEEVPEPPELPQRLQDGQPIEPEVTIIRREEQLIEEYRINGRMYMVKITPKFGPPYYLIDRDGDGRMESRMSEIYDDFVVPQWVILSW